VNTDVGSYLRTRVGRARTADMTRDGRPRYPGVGPGDSGDDAIRHLAGTGKIERELGPAYREPLDGRRTCAGYDGGGPAR